MSWFPSKVFCSFHQHNLMNSSTLCNNKFMSKELPCLLLTYHTGRESITACFEQWNAWQVENHLFESSSELQSVSKRKNLSLNRIHGGQYSPVKITSLCSKTTSQSQTISNRPTKFGCRKSSSGQAKTSHDEYMPSKILSRYRNTFLQRINCSSASSNSQNCHLCHSIYFPSHSGSFLFYFCFYQYLQQYHKFQPPLPRNYRGCRPLTKKTIHLKPNGFSKFQQETFNRWHDIESTSRTLPHCAPSTHKINEWHWHLLLRLLRRSGGRYPKHQNPNKTNWNQNPSQEKGRPLL